MDNFVQQGDTVTYTAPGGGFVAGVPIQVGQLLVVPQVSGASGARVACLVAGVVSYTKAGSQAWAEGALVYWDASPGQFTTTAAGNLQCGTAAVAVGAGAGETTGVVRLDGIGRVQET